MIFLNTSQLRGSLVNKFIRPIVLRSYKKPQRASYFRSLPDVTDQRSKCADSSIRYRQNNCDLLAAYFAAFVNVLAVYLGLCW